MRFLNALLMLVCMSATSAAVANLDTVVYEFTAFGDKGVYEDGWRAVVKKKTHVA